MSHMHMKIYTYLFFSVQTYFSFFFDKKKEVFNIIMFPLSLFIIWLSKNPYIQYGYVYVYVCVCISIEVVYACKRIHVGVIVTWLRGLLCIRP
jgi:hypothetical protein